MKPHPQLASFMNPYDEHIQKIAWDLRQFILERVPAVNELIWDNYNALAIAYSKSEKLKDAFCHVALYSKHVNFGFNRGAELSPSSLKLEGKGKLIRHLKVQDMALFPKAEIDKLLWEAVGLAEFEMNDENEKLFEPKSLVMSISEKKIRPNREKKE